MMSKEQFVKRMRLIQNFHSEQETLSVLIDKLIDGYNVVTIGNYLVQEIIDMIEEDLGYNDILAWWLYEDVDKVIYDKGKEISVRTLEELYDYISVGVDNTNNYEPKSLDEILKILNYWFPK